MIEKRLGVGWKRGKRPHTGPARWGQAWNGVGFPLTGPCSILCSSLPQRIHRNVLFFRTTVLAHHGGNIVDVGPKKSDASFALYLLKDIEREQSEERRNESKNENLHTPQPRMECAAKDVFARNLAQKKTDTNMQAQLTQTPKGGQTGPK